MLFEIVTLVLFWASFKFYGLYAATAALIAMMTCQCLWSWLKLKKVPTVQWVTCLCAWLLGGSTLLFHNPLFIQWKPTILYLIMAVGVLGYSVIKQDSVIKGLANQTPGTKVEAPWPFWLLLDRIVALFLIFMAGLNLYVVEHYSTEQWVQFKLFGSLIAIALLSVFISICIAKKATIVQES